MSGDGEYIPHSLRTIVNRISNYRTNALRLQVESQRTAALGAKVRVNLPSQGLINIGSLQMSGTLDVAGATIKLASSGISSLIQRVDLVIGGVVVSSINEYNKLYHMLRAYTVGRPRNRLASFAQTTELCSPIANGDYLSAVTAGGATGPEVTAALTSTNEVVANQLFAAGSSTPFQLNSWLGLIGRDIFLQMDSLPSPVSLTLTLDSAACVGGINAGIPSLANLEFNVEAVEFPLFSRSLYAMLERNTPIPIAFTNWTNFTMSNAAGAVVNDRFSVSTQALQRVWCQNGVAALGVRDNAAATQDGQEVDKFLSNCDVANNFYLEVDNRRTSQYDVDMTQQGISWVLSQLGVESDTDYECLLGSLGVHATVAGATGGNGTVATSGSFSYFNTSWALVYSLCFDHYNREDANNVSGLSTQGMSASIQHNARTGFTSSASTMYSCESKAILHILSGRQIEVTY